MLIAVLAYVLLDLGCPLVPGAFSFDPTESVEAVTAHRIPPPVLSRPAAPLATAATSTPRVTRPSHAAVVLTIVPAAEWHHDARRDLRRAAGSDSPTEDD
jgi:hypothetical protein